MRGYRRLTVTITPIISIVISFLADIGLTPVEVIAITVIAVVSLLGYNLEDLVRTMHTVGDTLNEIAEEIEEINIVTNS